MSIDVNAARTQSARIKEQLEELETAIKRLRIYRSDVTAAWKADEVNYITKAIDQTIDELTAIKKLMSSAAVSVVNTANTIAAEERKAAQEKAEREEKERQARRKAQEEAAEKERKLKQQKEATARNIRVSQAQQAYNEALEARDAKQAELDALKKKMKNASGLTRAALLTKGMTLEIELEKLNKALEEAERALEAAKK